MTDDIKKPDSKKKPVKRSTRKPKIGRPALSDAEKKRRAKARERAKKVEMAEAYIRERERKGRIVDVELARKAGHKISDELAEAYIEADDEEAAPSSYNTLQSFREDRIIQEHARGSRTRTTMPFEDAREVVRAEMIHSAQAYNRWWEANRPAALPKYPHRAYSKEWAGWNDFLGNENTWVPNERKHYRPFVEAAAWVHTLKLSSYAEWMEYIRNNILPADIPKRPELVYGDWISWGRWLGKTAIDAAEHRRMKSAKQVFFIIRDPSAPANILTYGSTSTVWALKDRWERDPFEIIKLFWADQEGIQTAWTIVKAFSTEYHDNERIRLTPNVWDVVWHLQEHLQSIDNIPQAIESERARPGDKEPADDDLMSIQAIMAL